MTHLVLTESHLTPEDETSIACCRSTVFDCQLGNGLVVCQVGAAQVYTMVGPQIKGALLALVAEVIAKRQEANQCYVLRAVWPQP